MKQYKYCPFTKDFCDGAKCALFISIFVRTPYGENDSEDRGRCALTQLAISLADIHDEMEN